VNYADAGARDASLAGLLSRAGASMGRPQAAWRALGWPHFWWAFATGVIGGMLFLLSHGIHRVLSVLARQISPWDSLQDAGVALGMSIVVALLLLLTVSIAEHGDHGQSRAWARYVAAVLLAVGASTAIVHALSPYVPVAALVGWYQLRSQVAIDAFVFSNWLLFGGLAVFVYVRLRRARRSNAAFERAEIERATASRQVLRSQLAAMQAQVEPGFLFSTLGHVEALYERDAGRADCVLDDLIAFLRAALPRLSGEASTLARESELAEAYLRVVQARMGSRLEFAFDIPPALGAVRFQPMLLLPLIDNAVRHGLEPLPLGGRRDVQKKTHAGRLRVSVSDDGLGDAAALREGQGLIALRQRLAGLYGRESTLRFTPARPFGVTATIEVPDERTSDHR